MVKFCSQCGARLEPDANFCGSCGARIGPQTGAVSAAPAAAGTTSPRPRGLSPKLVWSTLALLALLGVGYVAASPYIALHGYQSAVERRAFGELADAFDRDELKRSLTAAIKEALDRLRADDAEVGIPPNNELSMLAGLVTQGLGAGLDKALSRESLIELESMVKTGGGIAEVMVPPEKWEEALKLYAQVTDGVAVSTGYVNLNTFGLEARNHAFGGVRLLFKRHGLVGWRLASIETNDALVYMMRRIGIGTGEKALADAAFGKGELNIAERWLTVAAAEKDAETLTRLATVQFEIADAGGKKLDEALETAKSAAEAGSYGAAFLLSRMYSDGYKLPKDSTQSILWLELAYKLRPLHTFAVGLARGHERGGDFVKAVGWARRAVLSEIYVHKSVSNQDETKNFRVESVTRIAADFEEIYKKGGREPLMPWIDFLVQADHIDALYRLATINDAINTIGAPRIRINGENNSQVFYYSDETLPISMYMTFNARMQLTKIKIHGDLRDSSINVPLLNPVANMTAHAARPTNGRGIYSTACPIGSEQVRDFYTSNWLELPGKAVAAELTQDNRQIRYYVCSDGRVAQVDIDLRF